MPQVNFTVVEQQENSKISQAMGSLRAAHKPIALRLDQYHQKGKHFVTSTFGLFSAYIEHFHQEKGTRFIKKQGHINSLK